MEANMNKKRDEKFIRDVGWRGAERACRTKNLSYTHTPTVLSFLLPHILKTGVPVSVYCVL